MLKKLLRGIFLIFNYFNFFFNLRGDVNLSETGPDSHHPVIRTLYDHIDVSFLL